MPAASEKMATDVINQAMESFAGAMRTGLKVQEETAKWWMDAIGDAGSITCLQKKAQEYVDNAVPAFQQNAQECLKVLDQNSRNSLELLKKAYEAVQSESVAEVQAKIRDMWETSLATVRANVQSTVQLNSRLMQGYNELFTKATGNGKPVATKV